VRVTGSWQAPLDRLSFPTGLFDLVLSFEVLEHIPERLVGRAVAELARVSRGTALCFPCTAVPHTLTCIAEVMMYCWRG